MTNHLLNGVVICHPSPGHVNYTFLNNTSGDPNQAITKKPESTVYCLLFKMERAGLRRSIHNLIKSYLSDRRQCVYVNGNCSTLRGINCRVPQGSVLGQLLFLIYINDIGSLDLNCMPNIFADDTLLYYVNRDPQFNAINARDDLDKLKKYFRLNKFTLNVKKTKFMNIHAKRKIAPIIKLNYNRVLLDEVNEFKHLGILIDKHLTWCTHVDSLSSKLSSRAEIIRKLSFFLPRRILLLLYYSLINCHLIYLCIL